LVNVGLVLIIEQGVSGETIRHDGRQFDLVVEDIKEDCVRLDTYPICGQVDEAEVADVLLIPN
jgi:hypothetical protein